MSSRKVLTSTTSPRVAPAARRMSRTFSSTARVWARMSSTAGPPPSLAAPAMESSARRALVPETNMKSPARRKCGKVPRGLALSASTALRALGLRSMPSSSELHADVHRLGEERERVHSPLAADARELDATEGRAQIPQEPVIHPGDAHLHLPRNAVRALQVRGPHRSGETITGIVGELHRLLF